MNTLQTIAAEAILLSDIEMGKANAESSILKDEISNITLKISQCFPIEKELKSKLEKNLARKKEES